MGAVTIEAFNGNGEPISLTGVDLSQGDVTISTIDENQDWTLKTIDDSPETYESDFSGGRPDGRS
jgi:hypothetical protein